MNKIEKSNIVETKNIYVRVEFENGRLTFALKKLVDDDSFVNMADLALTFEDSVDEKASVDLLRVNGS